MKKNRIIVVSLISVGISFVLGISFYLIFCNKFYVSDFKNEVEINYKEKFNPTFGTVKYGNAFFKKDVNHNYKGNIDINKLGKYQIKYYYTYKKNKYILTQTVYVKDLEKPVLNIEGEELKYCPNGKLKTYNYSANDNVDGDITSKVKVELKDNNIIFSVDDSSGNNTIAKRKAASNDNESPKLTLNGNQYITIYKDTFYKDQGATAVDDCDGDLTSSINVYGNVDVSKAGIYVIKYSVKDSSNNMSTIERKVTVKERYIAPPVSGGKVAYLTFDDGPGEYTNKLLDILKKYNVKVTFFVTNQSYSIGYNSAIKRAFDEGHTIALHSYTHNYSYIYASESNYFEDLTNIQNKVKNITGYTSTIIRFPGGSSNTVSRFNRGIMTRLANEVTNRGFTYVDWNVSSGDAGGTTDTSKVYENVINGINSHNVSVVLQHDIKEFSVNAVEDIVKYCINNGIELRPLTPNGPTAHHGINN